MRMGKAKIIVLCVLNHWASPSPKPERGKKILICNAKSELNYQRIKKFNQVSHSILNCDQNKRHRKKKFFLSLCRSLCPQDFRGFLCCFCCLLDNTIRMREEKVIWISPRTARLKTKREKFVSMVSKAKLRRFLNKHLTFFCALVPDENFYQDHNQSMAGPMSLILQ